ncbi:MAG TPA: copper homeostasis protein CutC [Vicinamibacterales bacterium]|nr:copper homeostasis protein CutC [Vicinamibacterales bacterium]
MATSLEDAVEAARGGADRLEVVRDLSRHGLTPSIDLVRKIQREVPLPLRVMVRESDGFACGSEDQRRILVDAAAAFNALGVDGIVVGWIRDGQVDEEMLARVLEAAPAVGATFHRAFDALADPEGSLRILGSYPTIDHVLTGAGTGPWTSRCATLQRYARRAGSGIVMLPGGGIDEDAIRALAECEAVAEVHVGRAARVDRAIAGPVSAAAVRALWRAARRTPIS